MHELGIASNIVETVLFEIKKRHLKKVNIIGLKIGALTDVVPEALRFGFDTLVADTPLKNTKLEIEMVPIKGTCNKCKTNFEVNEFIFVCPECSAVDITIVQGKELDIVYIEVDDEDYMPE